MFNKIIYRYTHTTPSPKRLDQFKGDISAILLIASELLPALVGSIHGLFQASLVSIANSEAPNAPVVKDIHDKCGLLMSALGIIGSPLSMLTNMTIDGQRTKKGRKKRRKQNENEGKTEWLHLLRPQLYGSSVTEMTTASHVYLLAKLAASQPEPVWPLIVQTLMSRGMTVAKMITFHFGAFAPAAVGETDAQPSNFVIADIN